jgi:four helix bundle protein
MPTYEYQGRNTQMFARLPGYKNLVAWQAASDLTYKVSGLTEHFGPPHWRLSNQMRGAAISVGGNLAEGYGSGTLPNYLRYCHLARGSLSELGSYLQDCERDHLIAADQLPAFVQLYSLTTLLLDRLIQGLMQKSQSKSDSEQFWLKEPPAGYHVAADLSDSVELPMSATSASPNEP